jgi:hypothetical protein
MMEQEWQEPDAVLERSVSMPVELSDGRVVTLQGKPDKHIRLEPSGDAPGQWILIDYKTIDVLSSKPKLHWIWQTNVYAQMLRHNGILIDRIFIQQIGMSDARRVEVDMKPAAAVLSYIRVRLEKHMGTFDGTFTMENLPPMLNPVDDPDDVWLCNSGWCPVEKVCKAKAKEDLIRDAEREYSGIAGRPGQDSVSGGEPAKVPAPRKRRSRKTETVS